MMPDVRDARVSIRARLLTNLNKGVVGGIVLSALTAVALLVGMANARLKSDMQVLADILGNRSLAALIFNDPKAAQQNLETTRFNPSVEFICLYTVGQDLFQSYHARGPVTPCPKHWDGTGRWSQLDTENPLHMLVTSEIVDQGNVLGHVLLRADKKLLIESVGIFLAVLAAILFLTTLAVTVVTRRRLNTLMMPLEDLYTTAVNIAGNPLSEQRARRSSDDEVGELVDVFNRMLDAVDEKHHSLTLSEQRFRTLAASSPIGLSERDAQCGIVYANPRWFQITGLPEGVLTQDQYLQQVASADLDYYRTTYAQVKQSCDVSIMEYRFVRPGDGREIFLLEYLAPLRDAAGNLQSVFSSLADISELKTAQMELERLAFHDPLTQLPNRRFFREHLGYVIAEGRKTHGHAAICILDLDDFKKVNDTLGHDIGDQLLVHVASRIRDAVFAQDVVSRMGGDEFLILLSGIADFDQITVVGERILEAVAEPVRIAGHEVQISASLGVAMFPGDGDSVETLIKHADLALYNAKDSGRNCLHFFSKELDRQIKETVRLEQRLKRVLSDDQLLVYLQPLYATQTERIVWAESLLRWNDPEEGMISPDRFIPLAEALGLIGDIGDWVIRQTCQLLTEQGPVLRAVGIDGISVNLSARQFYSRDLIARVKHHVREYGLDTGQLGFEITESMIMKDSKLAVEIMHALRELGCHLSMDDFGTGYSSLSNLQRFPIDTLKIDRSFITEIPHNQSAVEIATAIIAMAHKLELEVVAEGVETEQQRQFLTEQGCEYLQGYLICRPNEPAHIIEELRKHSLRRVK